MRKVPVNLHIPLLLPIPLHRSREDAPQQHYSALIVGRQAVTAFTVMEVAVEELVGPVVLPLLLVLAFVIPKVTMVALIFGLLATIERQLVPLLVDLRGPLDPLTIIHPFS